MCDRAPPLRPPTLVAAPSKRAARAGPAFEEATGRGRLVGSTGYALSAGPASEEVEQRIPEDRPKTVKILQHFKIL